MVASACNPITQEAEAGKTLSEEKKWFPQSRPFLADFLVSLSLHLWAQLASQPLPSSTDILAAFEYGLCYEWDTK